MGLQTGVFCLASASGCMGTCTLNLQDNSAIILSLNPIIARAGLLWSWQSKIVSSFHDIRGRPTKILDFVSIYALIVLLKSFWVIHFQNFEKKTKMSKRNLITQKIMLFLFVVTFLLRYITLNYSNLSNLTYLCYKISFLMFQQSHWIKA